MRYLLAFLWMLACALAAGAASADQNDPRLTDLFARLRAVSGPEAARPIEHSIWAIWFEHSDNAVALLMHRGIEEMNRGDNLKALGTFDQVVKIAPDFAEGWNKRATVHYLLGNHEESLGDIEKTLTLEPRHFGALSGRGLVYTALDQPEPALAAFEAALDVHPHMTTVRINAEALRRDLEGRAI